MSTFALTTTPPTPLIRFLERQSEVAGQEGAVVRSNLDRLLHDYRYSLAITYREAALAETFHALAEQWRDETRFDSVIADSTNHAAYRSIVRLGEDIVPLLLRELRREPEHWFTALREITGVDPVRPEHRGDMRAISNAWLRWGHSRGLI